MVVDSVPMSFHTVCPYCQGIGAYETSPTRFYCPSCHKIFLILTKGKDMIDQLKRANLDTYDIEQLVELSAIARVMRTEFEATQAEVPSWLDDRTREIRRAISAKQEDVRGARLSELKSRRSALRTTEEKRQELDAEIAKLTAAKAGA